MKDNTGYYVLVCTAALQAWSGFGWGAFAPHAAFVYGQLQHSHSSYSLVCIIPTTNLNVTLLITCYVYNILLSALTATATSKKVAVCRRYLVFGKGRVL